MSVLLQVKDICKKHGATTILENASAAFASGQRIGVIGRNGAGKSTLCRIITGDEEKDSGQVIKNRSLRLGYLEQHDPYKQDEVVVDFLTRYTGEEEWRCGEMTHRFHLPDDFLYSKIGSLAGGFQTRVKLAAMMLRNPNFLILDEPSNYLDLSTLILLENFLQEFRGGYLIVSHDREFLKKTCDHTMEVEHGDLAIFPGNIEDYFEFKEEQLRQKMAYNKGIEKKKAQLQDFVDRFKAKASTATRAKSKMKQIDKLETIEIAHSAATVRIHIPPVEPKAGVALHVEDLEIGYPDKSVATGIEMEIDRGNRVAVVGDNGQGKTTFLRTIAGDLQKKAGHFKWGTGLKIAYYAQHVFATLEPRNTIFQHLRSMAVEGVSQQDILDIAGSFLFKGNDIDKKVSVLSGGERARLCLAGLLLTRSHVLLLDEPTNHLDFETVEALGNALKEFAGTVFFISHDRTFVNLVASNIIDVKNGKIKRYPGIYEEYVYHLECEARDETPQDLPKKKTKGQPKAKSALWNPDDPEFPSEEAPKIDPQEKERKSQLNKVKNKLKKAESRLVHYQKEKETLSQEQQRNPFHFSKDRKEHMREVTIRVEELEDEIKKLKKKQTQLLK